MNRTIVWLRDFTYRGFKPQEPAAAIHTLTSSDPAQTVRMIAMTHQFKKGDTHEALVEPHQFLVDGSFDISDQAKEGRDFTFLD